VAASAAGEQARIETLTTYTYLLAYTIPLIVSSLLAFWRSEQVLGTILGIFAIIALGIIWSVYRHGLGRRISAILVGCACLLFAILVSSGGYSETSLFWCFAIFVAVYHFSSAKAGLAVNFTLIICCAAFLHLPVFSELHPDYGRTVINRFLVTGSLTCILIFFYALQQEVLRARLRDTQAQLLYTSMTDELTGLTNRRAMKATLRQAEDRRQDGNRALAIAIADIDKFKHINDSFGHDAGDHALRHVSQVMRSALRSSDHVARWGGEEFLLLLDARSLEEALEVVERARAAIEASPAYYGGQRIPMTASFGLQLVSEGIGRVHEAMVAADNNLLRAKQEGRNRVVAG
jgi:diguanylate cyclase (GGDEF)-like protein